VVWGVLGVWWGEEKLWWVRCPGVDTLWAGIDLGIRLVAVVEWWGVLAHEEFVSKVVCEWEDDLFPVATPLYRGLGLPDRQEKKAKKKVAVAYGKSHKNDRYCIGLC